MLFFDALSQLGYAAINLTIVFILASLILFVSLRKWLNTNLKKSIFLILCFGLFAVSIIKFAEVNKALTDAYIANETAKKAKSN